MLVRFIHFHFAFCFVFHLLVLSDIYIFHFQILDVVTFDLLSQMLITMLTVCGTSLRGSIDFDFNMKLWYCSSELKNKI